jgi:hypothetical protein
MPRGGDQGGRCPRKWKHNTDVFKSVAVPPEIAHLVKLAALLIDKDDPEILELLKQRSL